MNLQNRRAKRVSQLSDQLYLKYYIFYNQPQIQEAIVSQILGNGIIVLVPFFELKLSIPFWNEDGSLVAWLENRLGCNKVDVEIHTEQHKQFVDSDQNLAVINTHIRLKAEGKTLSFRLYDHVNVQLVASIVNPNSHRLFISGELVDGLSTQKSVDEKQFVRNLEKVRYTEKVDTYHHLDQESISLIDLRKDLLQRIHELQGLVVCSVVFTETKGSETPGKHMYTRYQFGRFVTKRLTFKEKWKSEFKEFNDMENELSQEDDLANDSSETQYFS